MGRSVEWCPPAVSGGSRAGTTKFRAAAGRRALLAFLVCVIPAAHLATDGHARQGLPRGSTGGEGASTASAFLVPGHWVRAALVRLHGAGLLPADFDPSTTAVTRAEALQRLDHAAAAAREHAPSLVPLVEAYRQRFQEEFAGAARARAGYGARISVDGAISAGYREHRNGLLARHSTEETRRASTLRLEDSSRPLGGLDLAAYLPLAPVSLAGFTSLQMEPERVEAAEAYGVVLAGQLGVWLGRRRAGFGLGDGGSVVVQGDVPLNGAGLFLDDGFRFPGPFRHAGTFRLETSIYRLDWAGQIEAPWFFTLRTSVAPHQRVRLGVNRAVLFAGRNNEVPATFGRVLKVLAGIDTDEEGRANFENHVASVDLWLAPPIEGVPVIFYAEYGVEDLVRPAADMPAVMVGAQLAAVPGAPWLGVGAEWTTFEPPSRGRSWYDHRVFGTWTDEGRPLGHGLGGEGREWRVYGSADLLEARLRLEGSGYTRRRSDGNLYAPDRVGTSRGAELEGRFRFARRWELVGSGELERASDWKEGAAYLGGRMMW